MVFFPEKSVFLHGVIAIAISSSKQMGCMLFSATVTITHVKTYIESHTTQFIIAI